MNELRMYGLTPYQLTGVQIGIQFTHAVVEYGLKYFDTDLYQKWAVENKTCIVLNGGTTNSRTSEDGLPLGSLNNHLLVLENNGVTLAKFTEPDLGDQLTAIVFIVDERVFNKKDYPDFEDWYLQSDFSKDAKGSYTTSFSLARSIRESDKDKDKKIYQTWVDIIGGKENEFLRDFLKNFRLA